MHNSYRVHAIAKTVYFPQNKSDVCRIISRVQGKRIVLIGGGNNIILKQVYYNNDIIILLTQFESSISIMNNRLIAGAGVSLRYIAEAALVEGLTGLEIFWDIPGTVGGAIYMNAGAYGVDILSLLSWVEILNLKTGRITRCYRKYIIPFYRGSNLQSPDLLIVRAEFHLRYGCRKSILNKMMDICQQRRNKFPYEYPNAGSVFKKPLDTLAASRLIDDAGLKGTTLGGAEVSRKHAGFIINANRATGLDIIQLAAHIQQCILNQFSVKLDLEQVII